MDYEPIRIPHLSSVATIQQTDDGWSWKAGGYANGVAATRGAAIEAAIDAIEEKMGDRRKEPQRG